jgi:mRNA interferase MazF
MTGQIADGQIWWADVPNEKIRPVVILTRRHVASLLRRVLVAPITTTVRGISTEVHVGENEGLRDGSVVNFDNAYLLDVDLLLEQIGVVEPERWPEFCRAMSNVLGC